MEEDPIKRELFSVALVGEADVGKYSLADGALCNDN